MASRGACPRRQAVGPKTVRGVRDAGATASARELPAKLVLDLTHQPLGRIDVREEQCIRERIERDAQQAEARRDRSVQLRHPVLLRDAMFRGELEATLPELLEVAKVRSAAAPFALLHIVRE